MAKKVRVEVGEDRKPAKDQFVVVGGREDMEYRWASPKKIDYNKSLGWDFPADSDTAKGIARNCSQDGTARKFGENVLMVKPKKDYEESQAEKFEEANTRLAEATREIKYRKAGQIFGKVTINHGRK